MQKELYPNEKIEDLQCNGLKIIQCATEYRFTTDAVLLANYCGDMTGKVCVDLGAGGGVISLLLAEKKHPKHIYALEIQPQLSDMACRSVALNGLTDVITVVTGDLKRAADYVPSSVDAVVCNPPYRRAGSGEMQCDDHLAVCRHEVKATLADVISAAAGILNNRGVFYLVHQSSRLCEIVSLCSGNNLAVKEILPVCPRPNKEPNLVLIRAVKCGKPDCVLRSPLILTDENGNYTDQAAAWYGIK